VTCFIGIDLAVYEVIEDFLKLVIIVSNNLLIGEVLVGLLEGVQESTDKLLRVDIDIRVKPVVDESNEAWELFLVDFVLQSQDAVRDRSTRIVLVITIVET
jgi:hypothetical protein